jgi:hypothetical protein
MMFLPGELTMADVKTIPDQVYAKANSQPVYPMGYTFVPSTLKSWDDLDDVPRPAVKLCKVADPDCEACQ